MKQKLLKHFGFNDLLLIGALLVALALVWNTVSAMQRNYYLQQKFDKLQAEVDLLEVENQNLGYNINYLKTDSYLELAAREKFSKAASGETLVYLPNTKAAAQVQAGEVQKQTPDNKSTGWQGNLVDWWLFLQGREHKDG